LAVGSDGHWNGDNVETRTAPARCREPAVWRLSTSGPGDRSAPAGAV